MASVEIVYMRGERQRATTLCRPCIFFFSPPVSYPIMQPSNLFIFHLIRRFLYVEHDEQQKKTTFRGIQLPYTNLVICSFGFCAVINK